MSLTVTVRPDVENRLRDSAKAEGLLPEQLAARRVEEAELLWRIRSAAPLSETQKLHGLLRRRDSHSLSEQEALQLKRLLDERENRAAQRLQDLSSLSKLSGIPVAELMNQLGISPIPSS